MTHQSLSPITHLNCRDTHLFFLFPPPSPHALPGPFRSWEFVPPVPGSLQASDWFSTPPGPRLPPHPLAVTNCTLKPFKSLRAPDFTLGKKGRPFYPSISLGHVVVSWCQRNQALFAKHRILSGVPPSGLKNNNKAWIALMFFFIGMQSWITQEISGFAKAFAHLFFLNENMDEINI